MRKVKFFLWRWQFSFASSRSWQYILGWITPLWPVVTLRQWAVTVWQPCTKCSTGLARVDTGRLITVAFNASNLKLSGTDGCFYCYRLLLFVDEADAFLRKRSTVSLCIFGSNLVLCNFLEANCWGGLCFSGEDQWRPQSHPECLLVSHWRTEQQVSTNLLLIIWIFNRCALDSTLSTQIWFLPTGSCWSWPVTSPSSLTGPLMTV